jgi:hypothetical protein
METAPTEIGCLIAALMASGGVTLLRRAPDHREPWLWVDQSGNEFHVDQVVGWWPVPPLRQEGR